MSANRTELLTFAEAARRLGKPAKAISTGVYAGRLDPSTWPVVAGKRLIPADQLPAIAEALGRDRRRKENRTLKG